MKEERLLTLQQRAAGAMLRQSSDLQRVAQATTAVSGVTHSVQGFMGELRGAFHHTADFQRCHAGGHQEGSNTLGEDVDEQV